MEQWRNELLKHVEMTWAVEIVKVEEEYEFQHFYLW